MSGRRTNLALAALLAVALLTGGLAFATGTGWARWPVVAHGVAGLAIVLLVPWKSAVAGRGLRRDRPGRLGSVALAVLVAVALASGVLFSTGTVLHYGPLNAIQVHVGSALLALPLALTHLLRRPVKPRAVDLDRRNLLRAGALLGGAALLYGTVEGSMRLLRLPGRDRRMTGSHERGSFSPQAMPTTSWIDDRPPDTDPASWQLTVRAGGTTERWSLADLDAFGDEAIATLDCTSGWYSTQSWAGARLDRIVPAGRGRSVVVRSATGFRRRYPLADSGDLLLATRLGGEPLSRGHGAPLRVVAPGRRGFWWVKWVEEIAVDDRPWWWQSPFPLT